MKKLILSLLLLLPLITENSISALSASNKQAKNKALEEPLVIVMFSTPRSLSTAFLRMMEARKDFTIMNEPCATVGLVDRLNIRPGAPLPKHLREDSPRTFKEVKQTIFDSAQESPVFVKEIHGAAPYYHNDSEMMNHPNVHYITLIRNPHHMILSLYKKQIKLDPGYNEDPKKARLLHIESKRRFTSMPYKFLYESCQKIDQTARHKLIIVRAEDLYTKPEETAQRLCQRVGFTYTPTMLQWDNLGENFSGVEEWHEQKIPGSLHFWHDKAITSTGFTKPTEYELNEQGNPTFSEVQNPEDRALCKSAYEQNLVYYNLILKQTNWLL